VPERLAQAEDARVTIWLDQLIQDIRYAARMLRRNARFSTVVVLTLALGIGLNTAAFSVVNAVLLNPLSYPGADRLVWLTDFSEYFQQDTLASRADYVIWRDEARSFEQMAAYGSQELALLSGGEATQEQIASITGDFWTMTGAKAERGRLFEEHESERIVLSHELAQRRFGQTPHVVGRTLLVDGHAFTVSGVLPAAFRFVLPLVNGLGEESRRIGAYIPIPDGAEPPGAPISKASGPAPAWVNVIAKLGPGVSIEQAAAEMEPIHARLSREFPHPLRGSRLTVLPLVEKLSGGARRGLLVLLGAACFVLLIATANVAGLLLAQTSKRSREMAIRSAIGAWRSHIARQILTESLVLALLGGGAGLVAAHWLLGIAASLGADAAPRLEEAAIGTPGLLFAAAASLVTALSLGLGVFVSRRRLSDGSRGDAAGTPRLRNLLVGSELALALILLVGAGLMLKSFWLMNERPAGFHPENILSMRISLSGPRYDSWPPKAAYIQGLLERLQATPGVQAAGIDTGTLNTEVAVGGMSAVSAVRLVSPGYLRAMGAPLVRGRWPADGEALDAVLVNETFARGMGGVDELIGKRIGGSFLSGTIVGVVADMQYKQLDAAARPDVYYPYQRSPLEVRSMQALVGVTEPRAAAGAVRELVAGIDPTQPVYRFGTLENQLSDLIAPRIFHLALLAGYSLAAVLLALVGIYGLMAQVVEQRTREVGIRMALGARREQVVGMIVRQGMGVALAGTIAGTVGAFALTRLMSSMLYGVESNDPMIFAVVATALSLAALVACWGPARRAAQIDPTTALRHE
jgi:putative ABC transport system permease protein